MQISIKNYDENKYLPKFLEGGPVEAAPAEAAPVEQAPAAPEAGGEDPMQQLLMACQQAVQSQDCELAIQVCAALLQMAGGGGEAPAESQTAPVYRAGGKLSRRIPRN